MTCGLYVNELSLALLARSDPSPEVFESYQQCLDGLKLGVTLDWVLRRFEIDVLSALGYGIGLQCEAESQIPISAETIYRYEPDSGLARTTSLVAPWCVSGATLLALAGINEPTTQVRQQAKSLMQAVISHRLEGRSLRSRELLQGPGVKFS